jgi:hypothetical protein
MNLTPYGKRHRVPNHGEAHMAKCAEVVVVVLESAAIAAAVQMNANVQ